MQGSRARPYRVLIGVQELLIFAWRGRGKDELLARLRARRGGQALPTPAAPDEAWPEVASPPLADCADAFWDLAAPLDDLLRRPRSAVVADALLRQLDASEVTVRGTALEDVLAPAYRALTSAHPSPP